MFRENKPIHLSPYDHPDIYPGPRPRDSFIFYKGVANQIEEQGRSLEDSIVHLTKGDHMYGSFISSLSESMTLKSFLEKEEKTPMRKRIPVLAYGSNVCLAQLLYKSSLNKGVSDLYICFRATILDTDVVYGSFLAPYGALPAIIAPVQDAKTEVWVTFLEPEQLEHMNKTESGYQLREHTANKINMKVVDKVKRIYSYYCEQALYVNGSLTRFPDIQGTSLLPSVWQADMLLLLKERCSFTGTREEFIHLLRWNHQFRQSVTEILRKHEVLLDHPDWLKCSSFLTLEKQAIER
ncbi:hypothetical protein JOC85_000689 [Bacillus mesophilus]|uniref:Uncharacterized protein n=1 Tax=Bacillus mesophilus TaxID=1808955 RepID=A0A6M0Q323_9BACI|nr:hypothetical protein [Bacillus mesophilus]MBM7659922.1 hypothetical protein [Bacillus mesophilus]NEY70781.1 hypothetical protein [Bacillus mesophilus]